MLCGHRRHEQRCPDQAAGRKTGYEEKWRRGGPISGQPVIIYHGESTITHDGEGRIVKEDWEKDYIYNGNPTSGWDTTSRSIYSTVLGGEIASIEENFYGVMEKTRVYAGGAVIGEQQRWTATGQSTGETYSHIFRDPVSGSVIRGGLEEHYEPLGQKIDPVPPLEEPTYPGPNDGFNDARFPEWQCMAAKSRGLEDSELPQHCQRAAEQRNIWAKIEVDWPAWPDEDGNALKLADSPLFNGAGGNHASLSFATRTMSASLTTTAKRLDGDCDWDNDGNPDCAVTVTAMPDIPDFKDATFAPQPLGDKRLDESLFQVREILNGDNDCSKFFPNKIAALNALQAFADGATFGYLDDRTNTATGIQMRTTEDLSMKYFYADGRNFILNRDQASKASYRVFGEITINRVGPFASKFSKTRIGNYSAGMIQSQSLQILHELAHMVLGADGRPLIPDDNSADPATGKVKSSSDNTDTILAACKNELDQIGNKKEKKK